jgi:hypothetical protein
VSTEPKIYALPAREEIGEFVQSVVLEDAPRAMVIDFHQGSVFVHPDTGERAKPEFDSATLLFLLATEKIEHVDVEHARTNYLSALPDKHEFVAICAHPKHQDELSEAICTKAINEGYLILVARLSDQYSLVGMTLDQPPQSNQDTSSV